MKIFDKAAFLEVSAWIHQNARPFELSVWKFCYEGGSGEDVLSALACYQNEDGGFQNVLEPDCWNPESSPYTTLKVVGMLRKRGLLDCGGSAHPLVQGIFKYLESGVHQEEDGWLFCIPSNDNFPRAPWWTYSEETNRVQKMGITAGLCAFVLRYGDRESALFQTVWELAKRILKRIEETEDFGEMGVEGVEVLLEDMKAAGLSGEFSCDRIMEKLKKAVDSLIERNPENWQYYTPRPSVFIGSPNSPFYGGNEEIVDTFLDYLIDARNPGGVWNINWSWFDLGGLYAKEFAISENWWKAGVAMNHLDFLSAFGRLEIE